MRGTPFSLLSTHPWTTGSDSHFAFYLLYKVEVCWVTHQQMFRRHGSLCRWRSEFRSTVWFLPACLSSWTAACSLNFMLQEHELSYLCVFAYSLPTLLVPKSAQQCLLIFPVCPQALPSPGSFPWFHQADAGALSLMNIWHTLVYHCNCHFEYVFAVWLALCGDKDHVSSSLCP